ncbi:AtuA-related protein [Achromobacter xylosoxidans]
MTLQVKDIAYVRSGDKGDVCSVGLVARGPQEYAQLLASVTPADVKGLYGDWVQGEVECHPMDNIGAMMVIMRHALGGGATRTLRLDQTGKSLGYALLRLPVRDPS